MSDAVTGGPTAEVIQRAILPEFELHPERCRLISLSGGLINETFRVSGGAQDWVLQRINADVFPDPEKIMVNLRRLLDHVEGKPIQNAHLTLPSIRPTRKEADFYIDPAGILWRGLTLIPKARNLQGLPHRGEAQELGRVLGWFHRVTEDLPAAALSDTLPGFHVAPRYLEQWDEVRKGLSTACETETNDCSAFIEARRNDVGVLEAGRLSGVLKERVIHGDPKIDNVLFGASGNRAVSLIDLDTVKPGLVHYDLGDCLRSSCKVTRAGIEGFSSFDTGIFAAVLEGYLAEAASGLTAADRDHLWAATWLLPLELGIRFLTDYCQGNRYFKVAEPSENLMRARRQFDLVRSIEAQRSELEVIIAKLWMRFGVAEGGSL